MEQPKPFAAGAQPLVSEPLLDTHFLFDSRAFKPMIVELDESYEEFINPGLYALELADFLVQGLETEGYKIKFRCQEDWGHYIEIAHAGRYALTVGCCNTGDVSGELETHRVFVKPDTPVIRRWFKRIDVSAEVTQLALTIRNILQTSEHVSNIRLGP